MCFGTSEATPELYLSGPHTRTENTRTSSGEFKRSSKKDLLYRGSQIIELDDGKIYRKPLYLMVKTMVSCNFSLKPIH